MKEQKRFSWRARGRSFVFAFHGIRQLLRCEHNAWIHSVCAVLAFALGLWLDISAMEWVAVVMLIGLVLALETVNSAVEALCDKVSPQRDPLIEKSKDLAAAAVLLVAIAAFICGLIIFLPKILIRL